MNNFSKFRTFALTGIATLGLLATAHADVAVSNLGEVSLNGDGFAVISNQWVGMSFTVGTNAATATLASVDLLAWGSFLADDFHLELRLDTDGAPGALLTPLLGAEPSTPTSSLFNYVPASATTLNAGNTYWLTASTLNGSYAWVNTDPYSANDTGQNGWSIGDGSAFSHNQGANWTVTSDEPTMFAVNVAPVPEPSILALAGLGMLGLWLGRRRA